MKVRGAERLDVDRRTSIHVVEILGEKNVQAVWFYSVSTNLRDTLEVGNDTVVQYSADLSPGLYKGPGTYTLTTKPPTTVGGQGIASAAYILFLNVKDRTARRYDVLAEPCTLAVEPRSRAGRVDCPKLANKEGKAIDVEWSWERL